MVFDMAIETRNLVKKFHGKPAVDGVNLRVPNGAIYGFIGPNGSGKSTTMKMLLGLTRPASGEIEVLGGPMNRESMTRVGSIIEHPPGYGHLTGLENMRVVRDMLKLDDASTSAALATVGLWPERNKLVRNYSLGMKQRLGIAIALAREPDLLILDEPTNGLDPSGIGEVRDLLTDLAAQGTTIMISSHILDEVQKMATCYGVISEGKLLFQGSAAELFERSIPDLLIQTDAPEPIRLVGIGDDRVPGVIAKLASEQTPIYRVEREIHTLEEVFLDLTVGGTK